MSKQTLYRFWDHGGALLYVGISVRPWTRWKEHAGEKPWWEEVASVTLESFATREEVGAAELAAIRSEWPRYNIAGRSRAVIGGEVESQTAETWDGVHAPRIAGLGDLLWCGCNEPDWDSEPERSHFFRGAEGWDEVAYSEASRTWVEIQPYYSPTEFAAHVIEAVLGENFPTSRTVV